MKEMRGKRKDERTEKRNGGREDGIVLDREVKERTTRVKGREDG
jgi:hypothetical protein